MLDEELRRVVSQALELGTTVIETLSSDGNIGDGARFLVAAKVSANAGPAGVLFGEAAAPETDPLRFQRIIEIVAAALGAYLTLDEQRQSERHHLDQLIKLQNLAVRIVREPTRPSNEQDVLLAIAESFGFSEVSIGLKDGERIRFYRRYVDALFGGEPSSSMDAASGTAGRAIASGAPQLGRDLKTANDPDGDSRDGSELCVPIHDGGDVIGVLLIRAERARQVVVEDLSVGLMLAETLGLAITNHQRLQSLRRRNQQLQLVDSVVARIAAKTSISDELQDVLDDLRSTFGYGLVALGWIQGDEVLFDVVSYPGSVAMGRRTPIGCGIVGRVARTGEYAYVPDVSTDPDFLDIGIEARSEVCYPVRVEGEIIAVLNVESVGPQSLEQADVEIIGIIAKHLGIAVENERLLLAEREARRAVQAVERISAIVSGALELEETLRLAAETLRETFGYAFVVVATIEDRYVVPRAAAGLALDRLSRVIVGDGPVGRAAMTAEAVRSEYPESGPDLLPTDLGISSRLIVPIRYGQAVTGVLLVAGTDRRPLGDRDLEILKLFADHAAVALNNARQYEEIRRLAEIDPITETPNHRRFQEHLAETFERVQQTGGQLTIMVIDLDEFKQINDRYGHLEGDRVLRQVARSLRSALRGDDLLARYAGDEFVVILEGASTADAAHIGERIVSAVKNAAIALEDGARVDLSVSVGYATFPDHGATRVDLLRAADRAMFSAKDSGKSRAVGYSEVDEGI